MLNVVIPMSGKSTHFNDEQIGFPKSLVEISGKPIIEHVINNLETIEQNKRFIFILNREDTERYHLDDIVRLLCKSPCEILITELETAGAACSVLLASELINSNDPLIISNSDQVFSCNLNKIITKFQDITIDAGLVTFNSIHPHWSFCRLEDENKIVETSEKRPISKNAVAGFYYFKEGRLFIYGAMNMIRKDLSIQGRFFISSVYNELILAGKNLRSIPIENGYYHSFYSPSKIEEFEKRGI